MNIFNITGNDFFKALTGKYQREFADCLEIIYNSYRMELSYGIDKEQLIIQIADYFDRNTEASIQLDDGEILNDSRTKASAFLRKLRSYGWIENEFSSDGKEKIIMPNYSITMIQAILSVSESKEMEYQSEISAIYSLLTNETLNNRPYPQIIKPVYDRTIALFTELKKLNTNIRKYIDNLTSGLSLEQIMEHFFSYNDNIGSKAYHRMKTNDNVSRFRNTIVSRLKEMLYDETMLEKIVLGYQNIENCNDKTEAYELIVGIINDIISRFNSYDEIENEIERKHNKYVRSAVSRAKLAFLSTNNIEGKISTIIRDLSKLLDDENANSLYDDIPPEYCRIFNMFPQGFINGESLYTVPISKKIGEVEEIFNINTIDEKELNERKNKLKEKNQKRFSRKNINAYVKNLLKDRELITGSEIEVHSRRDMVRLAFIGFYGRDKKSDYIVVFKNNIITKEGFTFNDFEIKRRVK